MLDQPQAQEPSTPYYPPTSPPPPNDNRAQADTPQAPRHESSALVAHLADLARLLVSPQPVPRVATVALKLGLELIPEARSLRLIVLADGHPGVCCQLAHAQRADTRLLSNSSAASNAPHMLRSLGLGTEVEHQLLVAGRAVRVKSLRGVPLRNASGQLCGAALVDLTHPELPPTSADALNIVCDHLAVLLSRYQIENTRTQAERAMRATLLAVAEPSTSTAFESAPQATQAREDQLLRGLARALGKLTGVATALALMPDVDNQLRVLGVRSGEQVLSPEDSRQLGAVVAAGAGDAAELTSTHPLWPALASAYRRARGRERAEPTHALVLPVYAGAPLVGAIVLLARQDLQAETWQPLARTLCAATGERIHADRAEAGAEARASANDAFLSLMAHELRSPLTSVKGYAQLLMRQARRHALPDTVIRSTESIEQQAARISEMIDELHDAARIRRNRLELLLSPVDLVPIVRQQVERWAKLTPEHTFSLEIEAEALVGEWDPHRVTQIVRDLLDNATRFSPAGGPVEVRLRREGDEALLVVRDFGIGIPPEDRERIYEYLYRVPAAEGRNLSGLGLGLFVSGVIAQRLGGRLWLEWSHAGEDGGSEFRLALPLAPPEETV